MKERKSLQELAEDSGWNGKCEKCNHDKFWIYGTVPVGNATFRYKECRKCHRTILTTTHSRERVIRVISEGEAVASKECESDESESGGIVFKLA